jgi:hypothetical protein
LEAVADAAAAAAAAAVAVAVVVVVQHSSTSSLASVTTSAPFIVLSSHSLGSTGTPASACITAVSAATHPPTKAARDAFHPPAEREKFQESKRRAKSSDNKKKEVRAPRSKQSSTASA